MARLLCASLLAVLSGCDARGTEGHGCVVSGGLLTPQYDCDPGLVCNVALNRCEKPNQGIVGTPCSSDRVCLVALWCPVGLDAGCATRIAEGGACPAGVGCVAGLKCEKGDAGVVCVR
jgi:hypothetical protein